MVDCYCCGAGLSSTIADQYVCEFLLRNVYTGTVTNLPQNVKYETCPRCGTLTSFEVKTA